MPDRTLASGVSAAPICFKVSNSQIDGRFHRNELRRQCALPHCDQT